MIPISIGSTGGGTVRWYRWDGATYVEVDAVAIWAGPEVPRDSPGGDAWEPGDGFIITTYVPTP